MGQSLGRVSILCGRTNFGPNLSSCGLSEYSIEFNEPETLDLYGLRNGFLTKIQNKYLINRRTISLSKTLFDEDALIFKNVQSRKVSLQPTGVEIDIGNNPHLEIWAKPGAPFVCIEPWHSFDDASSGDGIFKNKPGIMTLPANETFKTEYFISVGSNRWLS